MAEDETLDEAQVRARPPEDKLAIALARSRIEERLFATKEAVRVGRYQLLELVGTGGMGVVYGAWDPELERRVAIKLVKATQLSARDRILAEGQALAKLSHPNVIPIYDVGLFDEDVYLVMEWVRGRTLRAWATAPHSVREIVATYAAAGEGLAAAHAVNLVHRDFKPDNAIIGDDRRVRVLDFGLAHSPAQTAPRSRAGTPRYMAPEQSDGRALTPAADQYAFGVALREALATREADGTTADVPRWLAAICTRATADTPADRFPSMIELLDALSRDPRRIWTRRAFAAGTIVVAGAAFAAGTLRAGGAVEVCTGGEREIAMTWSASAKLAIEAHLRTLGAYGASLASELGGELDLYAARWATGQHAMCVANAAGELSPQIYDQALRCLGRSRAALGAASDVLLATRVERLPDAVVAARSLPDPMQCRSESDTSLATPPPVLLVPRVEELSNEVARARVLALAADPRAIVTAEQAARGAVQLGYPVLAGRAQLVHGTALVMLGQRPLAVEVLAKAAADAFSAGDLATGVEALARQLFAIAVLTGSTVPTSADEAIASARLGTQLARSLGPNGAFARALLYNNLGTLQLARQDRLGAATWFAAALRERPVVTGEMIELAVIPLNLGLVQDDPARRDRLFEQQARELAAIIGDDHPRVLDARLTRAMFEIDAEIARRDLRASCTRLAELHPHLRDNIAQCAYELLWLDFDADDPAGATSALGVLAAQKIDVPLAEGFRALLAHRFAEAAAAMRTLAEKLGAHEHAWQRWRSVDALLVAAIAERRSGHAQRSRELATRALDRMNELTALSATTFYARRRARLLALRDGQ